ncbi:MAG: N2,N2-dimethylguanosine tRNA methyltransferase [Synechococcus sp.]|nr:N2,N2-dimethylguanosine tRNA methyltransferase [Synechococcus sp.]
MAAVKPPCGAGSTHYCEGLARLELGAGFFRPGSRPSRDLTVLLAQLQVGRGRLQLLDLMAGCGIRSLRCGLEAGAAQIWANDADPDRLPLLQRNLAPLDGPTRLRCTALTAQQLLAGCLQRRERFDLVDLDAFGCPSALLPLALEAVALDGVLVLTSSDGRSPTGHDRLAALRRLGAAARAHPASWELALRLQLGVVARSAWALGRGIEPLLSFSDGRTFRTAVRLHRRPAPGQERQLGLLGHCHRCGDQQVQSLLDLGRWPACLCAAAADGAAPPLAISGPLWIGALQDAATVAQLLAQARRNPVTAAAATLRILERLATDPAELPRCWPTAAIARQLGGGPPPLAALVNELRRRGHQAAASGLMEGMLRSDAPWSVILAQSRRLKAAGAAR